MSVTPQSRRVGALGMKCGMTMEWTPWGERLPLTVIELQDVQQGELLVRAR